MNELKPCPFCGSENVGISLWLGHCCITCRDCLGGIAPAPDLTKEDAVAAWNRRADEKVGKWIDIDDCITLECSLCKGQHYNASLYCPNCGAKMEDEDG